MRRIISWTLTLTGALVITGTSAAPASAKVVDHHSGHIDVTFPDDAVCDIPVTTHIVGSENTQTKQIGGYLLFKFTGHETATFTTADGRWVTYTFSGPGKDMSVKPLGGNIILVRHGLNGKILQLVASNGDAVKVTGRVVTETRLDDNGTPLNPDDDIFLDFQVVKEVGANNHSVDFCEFVGDHLG